MKPIIVLGLLLAVISASVAHNVRNRSKSGKKMVCYYGTWAVYRPGDGKFDVEDIDPKLCTHVVYGFTKLENNEIRAYDPWQDQNQNEGGGKDGFRRFTSLRKQNPDLNLLIAIGGWNEGSTKYSEMASNAASRRQFVQSVVPFLEKYDFDGLDLDWEYPTARGGKPEDREGFTLLVKELRKELRPYGYLLTAAVSPNVETVAEAYNVPEISRDLDFINVMCYDYHGAWDGHPYTGHNTPLYRSPKDAEYNPFFNANDTVTYWLEAGLPKEKLIMGMALYGRGFILDNPSQNGLYAPAGKGIKQAPYTRQDGIWGYNEICEVYQRESDQWSIVIDEDIKAPYAYNKEQWIGYEDVESLYYKAKYAREMDLGGAMVWSIETDDFKGLCHGEKYLLINTIKNTMNGGGLPSIPPRPKIVKPTDGGNNPSNGGNSPKRTTTTNRPQELVTEQQISSDSDCAHEGLNPTAKCSTYINCVSDGKGGYTKYYQNCAPGLAFDPRIKGCNYASAVPGCDGQTGRLAVAYRTASN